ncbi:MAG: hypothetical protein H8D56_09435, partial [Planctomycetes bacterium]|nr:hypothetical protein [Planctomycetota bacterium]
MIRKFLIFVVVILLFSSGTIADIGQVEGFSIGALNLVGRCGPIGSAQGGNIVIIGHSQQIQKPCFFTKASQEEKGILVQYGTAKGAGGVSGVAQSAKVQGMQGQLTKPFGSTVQGQRLNVNLGQVALKTGGVGSTQGVQGFVGGQSQTITTPRMTSTQTQCVGVGQYSAVSG